MSDYVFVGPSEYIVSEPMAGMRWLRRNGDNGWVATVLQQRYRTRKMSGGVVTEIIEEWRDVPVVYEEKQDG
jgi:hypothetical protein